MPVNDASARTQTTGPNIAALYWRPIETAPRDGTHILAFIPWAIHPKTLFWASYANEWRCPASERGPADDGWNAVSHWMPLPLPPVFRSTT